MQQHICTCGCGYVENTPAVFSLVSELSSCSSPFIGLWYFVRICTLFFFLFSKQSNTLATHAVLVVVTRNHLWRVTIKRPRCIKKSIFGAISTKFKNNCRASKQEKKNWFPMTKYIHNAWELNFVPLLAGGPSRDISWDQKVAGGINWLIRCSSLIWITSPSPPYLPRFIGKGEVSKHHYLPTTVLHKFI